jgi:hypothetical protein
MTRTGETTTDFNPWLMSLTNVQNVKIKFVPSTKGKKKKKKKRGVPFELRSNKN